MFLIFDEQLGRSKHKQDTQQEVEIIYTHTKYVLSVIISDYYMYYQEIFY